MENYTKRIGNLGMTITSSKTFYMGSSCFQSILKQAIYNRSCLRNDNISISSSMHGPAENYQYLNCTFIKVDKLDNLAFRIYEVECLLNGIPDIWRFGIHYEN